MVITKLQRQKFANNVDAIIALQKQIGDKQMACKNEKCKNPECNCDPCECTEDKPCEHCIDY